MRDVMARGRPGGRPVDDGGEGFIARVVDAILANPVRSGAVLVAALTTTVIVANALFFQTGRHPSPFFGGKVEAGKTDPKPDAAKGDPNKTVVKTAPPAGGAQTNTSVATRSAPEKTAPPPRPTTTPSDDPRLIADIQKALSAQGLYNGPADGKMGAKTKAAISTFQQKAGLPVNGEPSQALLARLTVGKPGDATASIDVTARMKAVQAALNQIGYGPVKIDGTPNQATVDAIRRFELDNGMPITGAAGPELIKKLQTIGALGQI